MTPERFIEQQRRVGLSLHQHEGVWWQQHAPFYCKPALPMQTFHFDMIRPALYRSLAGFSYMIYEGEHANKVWSFMIFEWREARRFVLEDLPSKKRNQVRKGLRCNEIKLIENIDPYIGDLREINITTRIRTGVGAPADYYTKHFDTWKRRITTLFSLEDRDWWGAFHENRLIAYYYTYAVGDTMTIDTAKAHTDYLGFNPTDALLYTLMEDALNRKGCRRIVYGGWTPEDEKLTQFKEKYGFVRKDFPVYLHLRRPARMALSLKTVLRPEYEHR